MLCEVLRPINGPGGVEYLPGQRIDTSGWRWAAQLITQHKLRPVLAHEDSPPETEVAVAFTKRGRPKKGVTQ